MDMYLVKIPDGGFALCHPTPIGLLPAMMFTDIEELERFAMGIVGYCQCVRPPVPDVFLRAFEEDKDA